MKNILLVNNSVKLKMRRSILEENSFKNPVLEDLNQKVPELSWEENHSCYRNTKSTCKIKDNNSILPCTVNTIIFAYILDHNGDYETICLKSWYSSF